MSNLCYLLEVFFHSNHILFHFPKTTTIRVSFFIPYQMLIQMPQVILMLLNNIVNLQPSYLIISCIWESLWQTPTDISTHAFWILFPSHSCSFSLFSVCLLSMSSTCRNTAGFSLFFVYLLSRWSSRIIPFKSP